ncbi:hypothetical protein [Bradyrhizobium sp. CCBAU 11357]|uniref:hypothetical protein n=1 Tax=Bradyrhizobium sp. CCBAU 11357 TaxID=1630808 RepID=UPI002302168D|nr:hypothetical protein [Bradyrhizobium sp. CCBAU 11357]
MIGTTCMLLCGFLRVHFAQQTAGAMSAPGLPCALLTFRGTKHLAKLGRNQPRGCEGVSAMKSAWWQAALGKQATGSVITITGMAAFPVYTAGSEAGWRPCGIGLHWFSVSFFSLFWQPLILRPQTTGQSARSAAMKTASPRVRG